MSRKWDKQLLVIVLQKIIIFNTTQPFFHFHDQKVILEKMWSQARKKAQSSGIDPPTPLYPQSQFYHLSTMSSKP